jgi:hypothetical protein
MSIFNSASEAASYVERSPPLSALRDYSNPVVLQQMDAITRQTMLLVKDFYVHLPLKQSSLGIDPLRELALLQDEIRFIPAETEFYRRLLSVVKRLRDRHTAIRLPSPWRDAVAYLPFALESYFAGAGRFVVVSKVMVGQTEGPFQVGVEITHWNGTPIRNHVENLSWQMEGANPYARIAMALRSLTARPLGYMLLPEEDWVTLTYRTADGAVKSSTFPWRIYFPAPASPTSIANSTASSQTMLAQGLDRNTLIVNNTWYDLFTSPKSISRQQVAVDQAFVNLMKAEIVNYGGDQYGYLRIFSFEAADPPAFLAEVAGILRQLPKTGLIIDIRSNPGGSIVAGEGLVKMFAASTPQKARLSFRNTEATRRLGTLAQFSEWQRSLDIQLSTGDVFSQGFPLASPDPGQARVYDGPVAVVIDALCYSTSDFFAAGMQDNGLAVIVGVDPVTGAGGANVWNYSALLQFSTQTNGELEKLDIDIDIDIAVRRSTRVGPHDGLPLEGLGVLADRTYQISREDVLGDNNGLVAFAASVLQ